MLHLMNKIILKPGKDRSVFRYHPWIFSGAIAKTEGKLQEGDLVRVYSSDNQYLATGHYQIGSIAVRILTFEDEEIGYSFWLQRITAAYHMRRAIGLTDRADNDTFRFDPWRRRQSSRISRRLLCRCCCRSIPLRRYVPGTGKYHPGPT